ncbi:tyrosine-type recombinase/integrase [Yersinia pestis]|uniref:tyrosine-type recombinase/integrase n=1 Tax=Yersinia pestis TaxID=632 RepID=UPI0001D04410|nr:site-specific integrase [Yersinia pestis]ADE63252.1 integrase [Yersinia pestis Z176003]MBE7735594.1 tyrosine-type recombinase/integrase [Yersinia pestis]MBE7739373.1 tyrosine-type recombinase/integrase [Yersinia pestis]MBE7743822.1 tyrosine-type recombinase/integrase [Yersinia pestis]MBE7751343.1 tyrosine-type recombinase/integrase [Yersinia pestis]
MQKTRVMDWETLLEEYFFSKALRPETEMSYRRVVAVFRKFIGNDMLPDEVTNRELILWRRDMLGRGLTTSTWNNKVRHLRAIYNQGIKKKWLTLKENPLNETQVPPGSKRKKILSRDQLVRVNLVLGQFEERENHWLGQCRPCALYPVWYWRTVFDVLRSTGMRQNQLLHVRLKDVDLKANSILLCKKGSKTHREWLVPIVNFLSDRMRILVDRAIAQGAEPEDYLFDVKRFLNPFGEVGPEPAIQPVRSFFTRLTKECGFKVSPHRFRHTLATEMMKSPDRNLAMVKGLLGHRSVSTTLEYVELDLKITGQALEDELSLYMDLTPTREEEARHALT